MFLGTHRNAERQNVRVGKLNDCVDEPSSQPTICCRRISAARRVVCLLTRSKRSYYSHKILQYENNQNLM